MFISFEGIDFSGKSTQIDLLKDYLKSKGNKVEIIREPGGTEISEKVRTILLDKENSNMFWETEFLLFSASRAQLVREKIRPYLRDRIYVISDRFHDSSTAYQGFGRGIPIQVILNIHKLAIGDTIPDITFFIDIPIEVAQQRSRNKSSENLDRIERSEDEFYEKVRNGYLQLADTEKRFRIIDGMDDINVIHKNIINEIETFEQR
ncbi:dTMP kinase [bacterium BMS3Abin03]|jgi:dTMP kinase|nr:dTMP kinase [bacterium BMS3Abin03]MCG6959270.1 dTMP kinase [bacterium BMS3Abin03]